MLRRLGQATRARAILEELRAHDEPDPYVEHELELLIANPETSNG